MLSRRGNPTMTIILIILLHYITADGSSHFLNIFQKRPIPPLHISLSPPRLNKWCRILFKRICELWRNRCSVCFDTWITFWASEKYLIFKSWSKEVNLSAFTLGKCAHNDTCLIFWLVEWVPPTAIAALKDAESSMHALLNHHYSASHSTPGRACWPVWYWYVYHRKLRLLQSTCPRWQSIGELYGAK